MSAKQIFDILPGIWKLSRQTLTPLMQWQNSGAECIKANGFASITFTDSDPNVLIYSEKVTISDPNDSNSVMNGMEAKQKYKYQFDPRANTLTKYFCDDRLFYALNFDGAADTGTVTGGHSLCGEHLCIEDNYVAHYLFNEAGDSYTLKYTIKGPRKCYEIITEYEKCPSSQQAALGIEILNGEMKWTNYPMISSGREL